MKLHRKSLGLALGLALLVFAAGCSGINTTQSVSPATFFLPGLLKADPPPAPTTPAVPEPEPGAQVAQVR